MLAPEQLEATSASQERPCLEVDHVGVSFGGITALRDMSFKVGEGSIHALIGPNGAGKTTAFNCITRTQRPSSGAIAFRGQDLLRRPAWTLPKLGIMRTFQHPQVCSNMTVLDNVLLGYHSRLQVSTLRWMARSKAARLEEAGAVDEAMGLLTLLDLDAVASREVDDLPYAALKRVELARALIGRPSLLLLDEPAAGLTADDVLEFGDSLLRFNQELGITIVLIEHNLGLVGRLANQVTVLINGHVEAEGTLDEVTDLDLVRQAFLGGTAP
jgi:branched-chain amino acid transport system ATP-binding protein